MLPGYWRYHEPNVSDGEMESVKVIKVREILETSVRRNIPRDASCIIGTTRRETGYRRRANRWKNAVGSVWRLGKYR
jgi:hypothetical protein